MPKIPQTQIGFIRHADAEVPLSGGRLAASPGSNLGKQLAAAGAGLFAAGRAFAENIIDTENELAAAEARNLWRDMQGNLINRMRENPGEYDKFADWAAETDRQYEERSRDITQKMSAGFRKKFDTLMEGQRIEAFHERAGVGIQAKVTADYNRFQQLYKRALEDGDFDYAGTLLNAHRGKLINENEYQAKFDAIPSARCLREIQIELEKNPGAVLENLRSKDKDGNYRNFADISPADRLQFIRAAEIRDSQIRTDQNQALLDELNSGKIVTAEDISGRFAGQTSPEALRQKNQQLMIVKNFNARKQHERDQVAMMNRQKQINQHEYILLAHQFPEDPSAAQKQYNEFRDKILTIYAGDGPTVKKLLRQLDDTYHAAFGSSSEPKNYKNNFNYQYAMERVAGMSQKDLDAYEEAGDWFRSGNEDIQIANYAMLKLKVDEFIRANPNATVAEIDLFIDNTRKFISEQAIADLAAAWNRISIPNTQGLAPGEYAMSYQGKTAIFGPDKKFRRWGKNER